MHTRVCSYVGRCMYMSQKRTSCVVPQIPSTFFVVFLRQGLSQAWYSSSRLGCLTSEPQDLFVSAVVLGLQMTASRPSLLAPRLPQGGFWVCIQFPALTQQGHRGPIVSTVLTPFPLLALDELSSVAMASSALQTQYSEEFSSGPVRWLSW